MLLCFAACHSA